MFSMPLLYMLHQMQLDLLDRAVEYRNDPKPPNRSKEIQEARKRLYEMGYSDASSYEALLEVKDKIMALEFSDDEQDIRDFMLRQFFVWVIVQGTRQGMGDNGTSLTGQLVPTGDASFVYNDNDGMQYTIVWSPRELLFVFLLTSSAYASGAVDYYKKCVEAQREFTEQASH